MNEKPQNIYISKMENSTDLDKIGWPVGVWLRWGILHHSASADEGVFLNNSSNAFGVGQSSPRFSHLNVSPLPYLNTSSLDAQLIQRGQHATGGGMKSPMGVPFTL